MGREFRSIFPRYSRWYPRDCCRQAVRRELTAKLTPEGHCFSKLNVNLDSGLCDAAEAVLFQDRIANHQVLAAFHEVLLTFFTQRKIKICAATPAQVSRTTSSHRPVREGMKL